MAGRGGDQRNALGIGRGVDAVGTDVIVLVAHAVTFCPLGVECTSSHRKQIICCRWEPCPRSVLCGVPVEEAVPFSSEAILCHVSYIADVTACCRRRAGVAALGCIRVICEVNGIGNKFPSALEREVVIAHRYVGHGVFVKCPTEKLPVASSRVIPYRVTNFGSLRHFDGVALCGGD